MSTTRKRKVYVGIWPMWLRKTVQGALMLVAVVSLSVGIVMVATVGYSLWLIPNIWPFLIYVCALFAIASFCFGHLMEEP